MPQLMLRGALAAAWEGTKMAKISLRAYNHDIENLVDQNQFDQAIAHARHILNFFPKHIQSYRLLGKAYLESQRYGDAADIFQRVLSSVPDDFVAHVGMSIVREDEGNLDVAIWHMERAFEAQPANVAIQGELRRLYGKRDGLEPPKVRLTRGALARMYIKGELYAQAITEIRTALAEDVDRPDLLVLLAQAYFLSNQRVEAANTCSTILQKLPYCYEANRILAEILAKSERASEADDYRKRLQLLDPYAAHIPPGASSPDNAPEAAIQIERLVWSPGQSLTGGPAQPEWAASLGVDLEATPEKESLPDWLLDDVETEPVATDPGESAETLEGEQAAPAESEEEVMPTGDVLPDWMKAIGWQQAAEGAGPSETPGLDALEEIEDIEAMPADIPDWLKDIAPSAEAEEPKPAESGETPEMGSLLDMPWLEETKTAEEAVPDWLNITGEGGVPEAAIEDSAGLLAEMEPGVSADEEPAPEAIDFSQELPFKQEPGEETQTGAFESLPGDEQTATDEVGKTLEDDEAFAWLENLAARQGATEAMLLEPEERRETPPDWVLESAESGESHTPMAEGPTELEESLEFEAELPAAETPGWLEELAAEQPALQADMKAFEEEMPAEAAEIPDWLREPDLAQPSEGTVEGLQAGLDIPEPSGAETGELPDWLRELNPELYKEPTAAVEEEPSLDFDETAELPQTSTDQLPDWLRSAAEEIPAETQPPEAPALAAAETQASEWVTDELLQAMPVEEESAEETPSPAELPDWLRSLSTESSEAELPSGEGVSGAEPAVLPDWLSEIQDKAPKAEEAAEAGEAFGGAILGGAVLGGATMAEEGVDLPAWLKKTESEQPAEPVEEFEMLFGPQELAKVPAQPAEAIHFEEPPVQEGDTQPSRVRKAPEEAAAPAIPTEEPAGIFEEAPGEAPAFAIESEEVEEIATADMIPDWLKGLGEETPVEAAIEAESLEFEPSEAEMEPVFEAPPQPGPEVMEEMASDLVETAEASEIEAETQAAVHTEEAGVPLDDESAFAWLESLAVKQGAEEALLLKPEERSDEPPDWIQQAIEEAAPAAVVAEAPEELAETTAEAFGEGLEGVEFEAAPPARLEVAEEAVEETLEAIPMLEAEESALAREQAEASVQAEAEAEFEIPEMAPPEVKETEAAPELPSWLEGVEDTRAVEEAGWTPETLAEEAAVVEAEEAAAVKLDLNRAGLIELERLPGVGFVRAQEIINYRQTNGPFFSVDELAEVPGLDADLVAELRDRLEVEFEESAEIPASAEPAEDTEIAIIQARNAMIAGDTQAAIGHYDQLIKTRQLLPEVIRDLKEALYRYPEELSFWQALGDAQVRAGNLQEAIDAYTKAEELLR